MPSYQNTTLHVDRPLSTLATAYENRTLIGLMLAPEIKAEKPSDKYYQYNKANKLQVLDPKVSSLQMPADIHQDATLANFSCEDYALSASVAQRDEDASDLPMSLRTSASLNVTALLRLAQEARIKDVLTTSGNYLAANVQTLAGADRWDNGGGDPFGVLDTAKDAIFRGPNTKLVAFCGKATWKVLRRHPQILDTIKGGATLGDPAIATREAFARMLEVDEFYVGDAIGTTSNPGVAEASKVYAQIWPKSFGIVAVAASPSTESLHFASTFAWQGMEVSVEFLPMLGKSGAWKFKVAHSTDEVVVCNEAGSLIVTPIA